MYTVDIHVHEYVCENSVCSSSVIILLVTTPTGMESGQPSSGMEPGTGREWNRYQHRTLISSVSQASIGMGTPGTEFWDSALQRER